MARILALEWDAREVRVAVANARGADVLLEQAFAIELGHDDDQVSDEAASQVIASALATALEQRNVSGGDALVALGRSSIELRVLSLPPAPPEERPDLVRFQAMQAFTNIEDRWPLDFVELEESDEAISVLAATISPDVVQQVRDVCEAGKLSPQCLVLRPFAAASLLRNSEGGSDLQACTLAVDLMADEADLTVMTDGHVVFMRTVRLPSRTAERPQFRALLGELRRTIGAAQNQLDGRKIERIVVFGDQANYVELERLIRESLRLDVAFFNPLDAVRLARECKRQPPEHPGRFASLLGMLVDQAGGVQHAVDFLHPRRRPEPPSQLRRNVLIAAVGILVVAGSLLTVWGGFHRLDAQIAELGAEAARLEKQVQIEQVLIKRVDAVNVFTDGDITWLDELRRTSRRLPDADKAILDEVIIGVHLPRGGVMTLKGRVREASMISEFEDSLRYGDNVVAGSQGIVDRSHKEYPWLLNTKVIVPPDIQKVGHSMGRPPIDEGVTQPSTPEDAPSADRDSGKKRVADDSLPVDQEKLEAEPVQVTSQERGSHTP